LTLTSGLDNLVGNGADNLFYAPVVQDLGGVLTNTLETGDVLNGAGGQNVLRADLIGSGSISDGFPAPAISATTNDIQEVYLRQQSPNDDDPVNETVIDAERMLGVEEWWSDNSREDIRIEDIRSLPEQTLFGMQQTDPIAGNEGEGAGLFAYFDPAQLTGRENGANSTLEIFLDDADSDQLENFPIDGIAFSLNGEDYLVSFDLGEGAERTYANLVTVLTAALADDPELDALGLTVALAADGQTVIITDPEGGEFVEGGFTWIGNIVPPNGSLSWAQTPTPPIDVDAPVETDVVLDDVGRTSQGGSLDIGSMGAGGVAVFNVEVDRSSWLTSMASQSNFGGEPGNLETVNLASIGANGDLTVGFPGGCDGRVYDGLTDVRTVEGGDFLGSLNLGILLTEDSIDRYLDGATEEVEFNYTASAQDDILTFEVNEVLSDDPDFAMNVLMGAGDDRLILADDDLHDDDDDDLTLSNVVVNGGAGVNTIVVTNSVGTTAGTTFEGFSNFQNYVVEGANDTEHNFTSLPGLTSVTIATEGVDDDDDGENDFGVSTTLTDLPAAIDVVISGENQTCGPNESNNDQFFGSDCDLEDDGIQILGANGETLDVVLDNTARVDAVLWVSQLVIDDASVTNESAVRTLNLESAGGRDTENVVGHSAIIGLVGDDYDTYELCGIDAPLVSTFNLTGTQDLTTNIVDAADWTATTPDNFVVDASDLTGDLDLGVRAAILTAVDDADNRTNTLTGTAGENDVLTLWGATDDDAAPLEDAIITSNDTTISEFETIRFMSSYGAFDATNVSDVTLYDVVWQEDVSDDLVLFDLDGTDTVRVNIDDDAGTQENNLTLAAEEAAAANTLLVEYRDWDAAVDFAIDTDFTSNLGIQDYRTITLDLGGRDLNTSDGEGTWDYDLNLVFLDGEGVALGGTDFDASTVYARTLNIIGGVDDNRGNGWVDSVDVGPLSTALTRVDLSDYNGNFVDMDGINDIPASDGAGGEWDSTEGTNATVIGNEYDFWFDVGGDNEVFSVSDGAGGIDAPEVVVLDFSVGGDLDAGASITIEFAGSRYVFTNTTGDVILSDDINEVIIDDDANAPSGFSIDDNGAGLIELTAARPGDLPDRTVAGDLTSDSDAVVVFSTDGDVKASDDVFTLDGQLEDPLDAYSLVTVASDFITSFQFNEDAYETGVVWQIDNFQAFDAGANINLGNQSLIDLRGLGVNSATDIVIQDAADWWAEVVANGDDDLYVDHGYEPGDFAAGDTVVTSNEGLNFTILLNGVNWNDLSNENFAGIA
jgi:hypothetical protein